jgi:phage repressor protein C with HTH and peptisase S24 domain
MARKKKSGFFDEAGIPASKSFDEAKAGVKDLNAYALEITGDSLQPVYRPGDIIIVSPNANIRRGDRVVVRTKRGRGNGRRCCSGKQHRRRTIIVQRSGFAICRPR